MKNLNLYRIWEILNKISNIQIQLSEENETYVDLLGHSSNYTEISFERFLDYYSFKVCGDDIVVFNDDKIAWEDFTNDDFSNFPIYLLGFGKVGLDCWIEGKIELQLEKQKREKFQELENKKLQIERLQKEVDNFGAKN